MYICMYAGVFQCGGHVYEGEFVEDLGHGRGTYVWADGRRYEGEFRGGLMSGHGGRR